MVPALKIELNLIRIFLYLNLNSVNHCDGLYFARVLLCALSIVVSKIVRRSRPGT